MLSGGLDSSSIACTASRLLASSPEARLATFSAIFPAQEESLARLREVPYINHVLGVGCFDSHLVRADTMSPLDGVGWFSDEPLPAPSLYMDRLLFTAAAEAGVGVILSGNDGDTAVSYGYEYLTHLAHRFRWFELAAETKALALRHGSSRWLPLVWSIGFHPLIPDRLVRGWRAIRGRRIPVWGPHSLIHPDFARRTGLAERVKRLAPPVSPDPRLQHARNISAGLAGYALEILDKTAAGCRIEARYPFYDLRLLRFCLSLPPSQKLRRGVSRSILRRSMQDILPPEVQWRTSKGSMAPNFQSKLHTLDRAQIERILTSRVDLIEPYVDIAAVRAAYARFNVQPARARHEAVNLFLITNLALWLERGLVSA